MFRVYLESHREADDVIHQLMEEHKVLIEESHAVRHLIEQVLHGSVFPRANVEESLARYLVLQREHLNAEEGRVFNLMDQTLNLGDWERIEQVIPVSTDPLFGGEVQKRYRSIFDQIMTLS